MVDEHTDQGAGEALLLFLERLHTRSADLTGDLSAKKTPEAIYSLCLYLSLLEFAKTFTLLAKSQTQIMLPATLRSFIETYVDFTLIQSDKLYVDNMEADNARRKLDTLKLAKKKNNPYLAQIANLKDIDNHISEFETKLSGFSRRKVYPLNIRERFRRIDFDHEYKAIYGSLSSDTHPSISALIKRHFIVEDEKLSFVSQKNQSLDYMLTYSDTMAGLLLHASIKMHVTHGKDGEGAFDSLTCELAEIRKKSSFL